MKTSELTGRALDWAVAQADGVPVARRQYSDPDDWVWYYNGLTYYPSQDWAQGGPIIEREHIAVTCSPTEWIAYSANGEHRDLPHGRRAFRWVGKQVGPNPLTAAMRCFVASKLGDEVEVPEELL